MKQSVQWKKQEIFVCSQLLIINNSSKHRDLSTNFLAVWMWQLHDPHDLVLDPNPDPMTQSPPIYQVH